MAGRPSAHAASVEKGVLPLWHLNCVLRPPEHSSLPEPEEESSSLNEIIDWVLRFLTKRKWWILLPGCGVTLVSLAVILRLPNRYTSEATLLVVRQQVPERYVVPNSTTD